MKKRFKVLTVLLIIIIFFTSLPNTTFAMSAPTYSDSELARAVSLGIGTYTKNTTITYKQFFQMLDNVVKLDNPAIFPEWKKKLSQARISGKTMRRDEGMLAISYAARSLGTDYFASNHQWQELFDLLGESVWKEMSWNYPLFPDWKQPVRLDIETWDNAMTAAYFYCMGRVSQYNDAMLFDFDSKKKSMRLDETLTYKEALRAALRLHDSQVKVTDRIRTKEDAAILRRADERRNAILNSKTTVKVKGTSYYVSNSGNDNNDGCSPGTAWATLAKVNSISYQKGDGVFFERGSLWRGSIYAKKGVTYSAYGTGEKPKIYGSPENGANPDNWSLLDGTNNIWVYQKDITDCGTLVFNNGKSWAIKEIPSFVNGRFVLRNDHKKPFIVKKQLDRDLEFFSKADSYLTNGKPYVYERIDVRDVMGKLYLRCDKGNPGNVFTSIEFLTIGNVIVPEDDTVFDNLCINYCGSHGLATWNNRITVQNCEFGWIGGGIQYYDDNGDVIRYGNAIESDGTYDLYNVLNNYIYQVYDAGASNQEVDEKHEYTSLTENVKYSGNLIEKCTYGIEIFMSIGEPDIKQHYMRNILIEDNYILYTGYGWGSQRPDVKTPTSIQLWEFANPSEKFFIKNNVLYLSTQRLVNCGAERQWMPVMSGNTYVQNTNGLLGHWRIADGKQVKDFSFFSTNIISSIRDILGDRTAVLLPNITK